MFSWKRQKTDDGPAILDETYLKRLAGHVGEDVVRELLSDGILELSDRIDSVWDHVQAGNREQVARTVHDIAGAAGHLGLSQMSQTAVQMERELRDDTSDMTEVTEALRRQGPEAIAAVRDFLDSAAPR